MNFSELEQLMSYQGISTLAEIARTLNTTPQAVSNWKARNQVPHHIQIKINHLVDDSYSEKAQIDNRFNLNINQGNQSTFIAFSDFLLILSQQLKIIIFITFLSVLLTFTYVQFILVGTYKSSAKVLIPKEMGTGGLSQLVNQFGGSMPQLSESNLSNSNLLPELLDSRTFKEQILSKSFITKKFGKEMKLLDILSAEPNDKRQIAIASGALSNIIELENNQNSQFTIITITTEEALFSKILAEAVIENLLELNRFFKIKSIEEKIKYIQNRIKIVKNDLELYEKELKDFNAQNRQISSPALQLQLDRFNREVEVKKGIFLTLKQQLEITKIEEFQKATVLQILDYPNIPLFPSNKKLKISLVLALLTGLIIGVITGFIRSYFNAGDLQDRKKFRKTKRFIYKKTKEFFTDKRITGPISIIMVLLLPYYFSYQSLEPIIFDKYSIAMFCTLILYILICTLFLVSFIFSLSKKK
jgi:uncharacterized protein involved in exopolysaccharide biosynthesis